MILIFKYEEIILPSKVLMFWLLDRDSTKFVSQSYLITIKILKKIR